MTINPFDIICKPRIEVTILDEMVVGMWFIVLVVAAYCAYVLIAKLRGRKR